MTPYKRVTHAQIFLHIKVLLRLLTMRIIVMSVLMDLDIMNLEGSYPFVIQDSHVWEIACV